MFTSKVGKTAKIVKTFKISITHKSGRKVKPVIQMKLMKRVKQAQGVNQQNVWYQKTGNTIKMGKPVNERKIR